MTSTPPTSHSTSAIPHGLGTALISAAAFATSGVFARSLIDAGWTPGAAVLARITLAAIALLPPAIVAMRGHWADLGRHAGLVVLYGALAVAGCQLAFFNAVGHVSVGIALLMEYLGTVLLMAYLWATTRIRPPAVVLGGAALAICGLALVLNVASGAMVSGIGVIWGMVAAVGLATYFHISSHEMDGVPPIAAAAFGLVVGAVVLAVAALVGILPITVSSADVTLAGHGFPFWWSLLALALVSTSLAYATGIVGVRRLGSTLASFVGLAEVLFAIVFSWLMLGQKLSLIQLIGGLLMLAGVVAVRLGQQPVPEHASLGDLEILPASENLEHPGVA